MKWMTERDLLIAQTTAFVQSVAKAKAQARIASAPAAAIEAVAADSAPIDAASIDSVPVDAEPIVAPLDIAPVAQPVKRLEPLPGVNERAEIIARVAAFRANQQRHEQQRAQFFDEMLARARAMLGN